MRERAAYRALVRGMPSKVSSAVRRLKTRLARGWKPSIGTSTELLIGFENECELCELIFTSEASFYFSAQAEKFFIFTANAETLPSGGD